MRRGVVRLVTPGTLTEDTLLDARTNNYLLAIARARGSSGGDRIGLAWIDISTSEFMVTECSTAELAATLARINPNEVIVTDALYGDPDLGPLLRELPAVTPLTRDVFDGATAERRLCDYFAVATMDGLSRDVAAGSDRRRRRRHLYRPHAGRKTPAAVAAVARGRRHHDGDRSRDPRQSRIDADARRRTARLAARCHRLHGDRGRIAAAGATAGGAADRQRGDRAAAGCDRAFVADSAARDDIRTTLRAAPDMSRALARLSVGRGGPRDLAGLRDGILAADQALARLAQLGDAAGGDRRRDGGAAPPVARSRAANSNARWPNNCR